MKKLRLFTILIAIFVLFTKVSAENFLSTLFLFMLPFVYDYSNILSETKKNFDEHWEEIKTIKFKDLISRDTIHILKLVHFLKLLGVLIGSILTYAIAIISFMGFLSQVEIYNSTMADISKEYVSRSKEWIIRTTKIFGLYPSKDFLTIKTLSDMIILSELGILVIVEGINKEKSSFKKLCSDVERIKEGIDSLHEKIQ